MKYLLFQPPIHGVLVGVALALCYTPFITHLRYRGLERAGKLMRFSQTAGQSYTDLRVCLSLTLEPITHSRLNPEAASLLKVPRVQIVSFWPTALMS